MPWPLNREGSERRSAVQYSADEEGQSLVAIASLEGVYISSGDRDTKLGRG